MMVDETKDRMQHLLMLQRHRNKRDDFVAALAAHGVEQVVPLPIVKLNDENPRHRLNRSDSSEDVSESVGMSRESVRQRLEELATGRADESVRVWFTDPDVGWAEATWSFVTTHLDALLEVDGDGIVIQSPSGLACEIEFLPEETPNGPHEFRVWR